LYQHALVGDTASAVPQRPAVPVLGKAGKNILIVVNKPDTPFLPDGELEFLTKILTACQLGLADVAIVNWHKAPHQNTAAIMEQVSAKEVILFDTDPALFGLPSDLSRFTVTTLQNRQFVAAPALKEIEKTREAKQQLWLSLKQLFCV
jgi:hypothetical protein